MPDNEVDIKFTPDEVRALVWYGSLVWYGFNTMLRRDADLVNARELKPALNSATKKLLIEHGKFAQDDRFPNSPYGVICRDHGKQGLTSREYSEQLSKPNWICPRCHDMADWDDDRFQKAMDERRSK